jgi:Zn-dependent alcohol dehydrogenase
VAPVPFKLERAKEIGATHTAAALVDAQMMLPELTMGRNADAVILTPGVLMGEMIAAACACGSKDARIVVTAIAPFSQMDVQLNLFNLAMFNQSVLGTIFGSQSPRVQVPNLLNLYAAGQLEIDELISQEYTLDQVQQGYEDQAAGTIIRGIVRSDD